MSRPTLESPKSARTPGPLCTPGPVPAGAPDPNEPLRGAAPVPRFPAIHPLRRGLLAASLGLSLAALLTLTGCDDPTDPPGGTEEGIHLTYSDGGSYQTAGPPQITGGELDAADFAIAFPDSTGGLVIATFQGTEGTRGDLFILQFVEQRTGTFQDCGLGGDCHGRILEGIDAADLSDVEAYWEITGGSVTLDEAGPDRVSGSVSDLLLLLEPDGLATRTIQDGTFDLALLSEDEGVAVMECFLTRVTGGSCQ